MGDSVMFLGRPKYPIEALLRPPVELYSAWTAWLLAIIAIYMPSLIMMTQGVAYVASATLFLIGLNRFSQGYTIWRYHKSLVRLPYYGLKPRQIPVSKRDLFLGIGFKWTQRHTQRLQDALDPVNEDYLQPGLDYRIGRALEGLYFSWPVQKLLSPFDFLEKHSNWFQGISKKSKNVWLAFWFRSIFAPLPPVGGKPAIHAVGMLEGEKAIVLPLGERVGHTL
ncbi:MAG: hypothetical protein HUJ13_08205, partial [Hydrogenovibrio crunogenus]|nr:hypothetical protein [Hydrogenovibrio crunogenus]